MTHVEFKTLRARLAVNRASLAARLGVTGSAITRWESGERGIPFAVGQYLRILVIIDGTPPVDAEPPVS